MVSARILTSFTIYYLGGGAILSEAAKEVAEFAEKIDAPVCDTLMGKGAFDGRSSRYTGMIGMHGPKFLMVSARILTSFTI